MEDFFNKVLEGNTGSPPENCLNSLQMNFPDAMNVEWHERSDHFEAIFYKNNFEHIAIFSQDGLLAEYRVNITEDFLPELHRTISNSKGELMNVVMRNKGNSIEYEIIVRDKDLNRYMVVLSDIGTITEERKL